MDLCSAKHLHNAGQQPIDASAHVDGLHGQADGVDADHRSNSRLQVAHSDAAPHSQLTLIATGPQCSSMRMPAGAGAGADNRTGTNALIAVCTGVIEALSPQL